ncbi:hypothetical protein V8F33_010990 [Rhypophila sp. PSN 637]
MTEDTWGRARRGGRVRRGRGYLSYYPDNQEGSRGGRSGLHVPSNSYQNPSCMTTAQSTPLNNTATDTSQPLLESKSSTMSSQQTSQPKPIDANGLTTNPPGATFATFGSSASNPSANQASQTFGSFASNRSDVFANQASPPRSGILENDTTHNSAPFGSKLLVGAAPGGNANSSSWPNGPVQPHPMFRLSAKNSSANSPTCAFGQSSPLPTPFSFGRSYGQKPQTGPENPAKAQMTTPTFGKRQAEDQYSTSDLSQDTAPPKKLLKREPWDESRIKNLPPATNANSPDDDVVFLPPSTITKELQSFGSKIRELQEGIEEREKATLKRRELNAWREEERQKLSARRAICLAELKEAYDKLEKIQKEEEDLEEPFREKTSLKKIEKAHENSA